MCRCGCWCGGSERPLLLDRIGVRDIGHLEDQMTPVVWLRSAGSLGWVAGQHVRTCGKLPRNAHNAPELPHLHVRAWPRRDGRPRQDCRPRTGRPGRLVSRGACRSPQAQPRRPQSSCADECRLPCGPNRAGAGLPGTLGNKNGWMKQRLGRPLSHRELLSWLQ